MIDDDDYCVIIWIEKMPKSYKFYCHVATDLLLLIMFVVVGTDDR